MKQIITEEKQLRDYFINNQFNFGVTEYFAGCKFKYDGKILNTCGYTPKYILGASMQVKKDVKKHIKKMELLPNILNYTHTEPYYIYREKPTLSGHQYDIKGAYLLFLSQIINESLYKKLLNYKARKIDVNKIIGMALLGSKLDITFKNGRKDTAICVINELRPVFFLLRYLTIETLSLLLNNCFKEKRIARYIDSIIISEPIEMEVLNNLFLENLKICYNRLNDRLLKYCEISLTDIFDFTDNLGILDFHHQQVNSLNYVRNPLTNAIELSFFREIKEGGKFEKITYKKANCLN